MVDTLYFFDSYALIELIKGNENYKKYTLAGMLFTKLNLYEVYYALLRLDGAEQANSFLYAYSDYIIDYDEIVIADAAHFRFQYAKKNMSMVDVIGYTIAKRWNVKFLTGDQQFADLENVEYVK